MDWNKYLLVGGGALAIGAFGYYFFQKMQKEGKPEGEIKSATKSEKKSEVTEEVCEKSKKLAKVSEETKRKELAKPDVTYIMDEVLVDSMEIFSKFAELAKNFSSLEGEEKGYIMDQFRENIQLLLVEIEKGSCKRYNVDLEEYNLEVEARLKKGDPEVINRMQIFAELTDEIENGKRPIVRFDLEPNLTKEVTVHVYRMVILSHLYLHHHKIQEYISKNDDIDAVIIGNLIGDLEQIKQERRDELLKRYKVVRKKDENYRTVLQKAYYTYRTNDPEFEQSILELLEMQKILEELIYAKMYIMEFEKDPHPMEEEEFNALYKALLQRYCQLSSSPVKSNEEEKAGGKNIFDITQEKMETAPIEQVEALLKEKESPLPLPAEKPEISGEHRIEEQTKN